jgi:hypothetical protein
VFHRGVICRLVKKNDDLPPGLVSIRADSPRGIDQSWYVLPQRPVKYRLVLPPVLVDPGVICRRIKSDSGSPRGLVLSKAGLPRG